VDVLAESEIFEIHYKDRLVEIVIKGPNPEFVRQWWVTLEKKTKRSWGIGPKKPEAKK